MDRNLQGLHSGTESESISHSVMSNSYVTPWTVAHQASQSMEFSRQEYWSGLPFPSPRNVPHPGIEPASLLSPAQVGSSSSTIMSYSLQPHGL